MGSAHRLLGLGFIALFVAGLLAEQDKGGSSPPKTLPTHWEKLGLSDQQKGQVYTIQDSFQVKIEALNDKIKDLKAKEKAERESVLTETQKTLLENLDGEKK